MKNTYFLVLFTLLITAACKRKTDTTMGVWDSSPVKVASISPIYGGAVINYEVPADENLLYVMVEYQRNGKTFTEKSSVYKNQLTIEGFDTVGTVNAKLYKVNTNNKRSAATDISFVPLESLVSLAKKSLIMQPGFGGVIASWSNIAKTELGVRFSVIDSVNKMTTREMYYTASETEKHSFRGFQPKPLKVAISFEDKWGNISDTTFYTTTPYFETLIAKPYTDFRSNVPYDNVSNLSGKTMSYLWDNIVNTSAHGWLTNPGNSGISVTIDLRQVVKLSRIIIHGYHINTPFDQVNIQRFELWGINKFDYTKSANKPYWLDEFALRNGNIYNIDPTTVLPDTTFKNDWQYLGAHAIPRYDQMIPVDATAIANISQNGTEYEMPIDAKPVRYIRLFVRQVTNTMPPPTNNYFSMGEITVYGDNTVPQQ